MKHIESGDVFITDNGNILMFIGKRIWLYREYIEVGIFINEDFGTESFETGEWFCEYNIIKSLPRDAFCFNVYRDVKPPRKGVKK